MRPQWLTSSWTLTGQLSVSPGPQNSQPRVNTSCHEMQPGCQSSHCLHKSNLKVHSMFYTDDHDRISLNVNNIELSVTVCDSVKICKYVFVLSGKRNSRWTKTSRMNSVCRIWFNKVSLFTLSCLKFDALLLLRWNTGDCSPQPCHDHQLLLNVWFIILSDSDFPAMSHSEV